jgi:signal transduction histidine kinase
MAINHKKGNMTQKNLLGNNGVKQPEIINPYSGNTVTEIIPNGLFTVDQNWIVKSWNNAAEKLLRVPANDIIGKSLWDTFAGTLPLNFYSAYRKTLLKDIPLHFKKYWPQMRAWFDVFTFYDEGNLSVSFKSVPHDGSEADHKQQLKVLNELYRYVTEVTHDCLWEWDLQAREIFWIDGGHKRAFGYKIENTLVPQNFWESRVHPDDRLRILTGLNKIINESLNPVWEAEYRFKKANNEYAYVHDRGHIIRNAENVAIRMIGATQNITARKLSEIQLLEERQTKQREITSAVITAQENERAEIGRELHDNLNQILAVTKLYIDLALSNKENKEIYLEKSRDFITTVIMEVRKISKKMIIPGMNGLDLFDNIRNVLNDLAEVQPIKIEFQSVRVEIRTLNEKLQLNIFRIVQEQINNILKHSQATKALIKLTRNKNEILLAITDDGVGCDLLQASNGVGLRNIVSRAELCQGVAEFFSKPGEGFLLSVSFKI